MSRSGRPPSRGCRWSPPAPLLLLLLPLPLLVLLVPAVLAQHATATDTAASARPASISDPSERPVAPLYSASYLSHLSALPDNALPGARWPAGQALQPQPPPPCSDEGPPPRAARARLQLYPPQGPVLPPPRTTLVAAPYPYASPRSDHLLETDVMEAETGGTRRGYYGHEVGYGSYFPIGLDPLTILAGLAFLAFIIQTLYLLLYKHYGLGLGVSAGAGIGPLSADRHQRDEQQAWANTIASRIASTASVYEGHANATADLGVEPGSATAQVGGALQQQPLADEADADDGRQRRQMGLGPLDALLTTLRRTWAAPARSCGPSWLCKLVYFARMLTEHLRVPGRNPGSGRASTADNSSAAASSQ